MLECLSNIIGLTSSDCECWDSSKPANFNDLNESSSGYYVAESDTIPLRWTNTSADCENGGIWDLIINSRSKGIDEFFSDFLQRVEEKKELKYRPFTTIGDKYFSSGDVVNYNTLGVYIEPARIKGGQLYVEGVELAFFSGVNTPVNITVNVYKNNDFVIPIGSGTGQVSTNKEFTFIPLDTPITIDFTDSRPDKDERYYFLYELPNGFIPVNNDYKIRACCGKNNYHENPYLEIMDLRGVQLDGVQNVNRQLASSRAHGMIIKAKFNCDYYSWLCDLAVNPKRVFETSQGNLMVGMALVQAIQAKSVIKLATSILKSSRINHFTMLDGKEGLYMTINHYKKEYEEAMKNLVHYMPKDTSDCLKCRPDNRIIKSNISIFR